MQESNSQCCEGKGGSGGGRVDGDEGQSWWAGLKSLKRRGQPR